MFTEQQLQNAIFFDIETAAEYASIDDAPAFYQKLWSKQCEFLRKMDKHAENATMTDAELYLAKASLKPEFSKIVCISVGRFVYDNGAIDKFVIGSICKENEATSLKEFATFLKQKYADNKYTFLCGHSIKRFDIPVLCKRYVLNNLPVPEMLNPIGKKPWEISHIDTTEVWSFGTWQEGMVSLDCISQMLGLPSPKADISGADVTNTYYSGSQGISKIKTYCEGDVKITAGTVMRMSNYSLENTLNALSLTKD